MKYLSLILLFVLFSCGKEETVLLPQSDVTIVKDVQDYSPIYLFFKTKGKDTLVEVNRKNSISSTNWIFHIDKRLPLRLVVPAIIKLQAKKVGSAHKSETSENYFSYSDSVHKNLAFLPFTKVFYKLGKPLNGGFIFYFKKESDLVLIDNIKIKKSKVLNYLYSFNFAVNPKILLLFDKNMSFEEYLQTKILVRELDNFNKEVPKEFIY